MKSVALDPESTLRLTDLTSVVGAAWGTKLNVVFSTELLNAASDAVTFSEMLPVERTAATSLAGMVTDHAP